MWDDKIEFERMRVMNEKAMSNGAYMAEFMNNYVDPLWKIPDDKIVVNFENTDIKNVFRLLGEASGISFKLAPDVAGRITMGAPEPTPIREIVDEILKHENLFLTEEDGVFMVEKDGEK